MKGNLPASYIGNHATCDEKIGEVEAMKGMIEEHPDRPLAQDMNKYLARATVEIMPLSLVPPQMLAEMRVLGLEKRARI